MYNINAIVDRMTWYGADIGTPETAFLQPLIEKRVDGFLRQITWMMRREGFDLDAFLHEWTATLVTEGFQIGLANGKHLERNRRGTAGRGTTFKNDPEGKKERLYRAILSAPVSKVNAIYAALEDVIAQQTEANTLEDQEAKA